MLGCRTLCVRHPEEVEPLSTGDRPAPPVEDDAARRKDRGEPRGNEHLLLTAGFGEGGRLTGGLFVGRG